MNATSNDAPRTAPPADADLLTVAQNQKTSAEVLEQVAGHPALTPEVVVALLRHPNTPRAAVAQIAARATGRILDVLLGSLDRLGRWIEGLEALLANPELPPAKQPTIRQAIETARKRVTDGERKKTLLLRIKELPVGQRLALAKKGNKDVRMILIKDSNEMIAMETVSSSRITEGEILSIAMMRDVAENVLRHIANNRRYRQQKQIILALLNNPKTPVGVALSLNISGLTDRELTDLAKNKNVPAVVGRAAQSILARRKGAAGQAAGGH